MSIFWHFESRVTIEFMSGPSPLTACDSEPIHLLGAIQPIGFLVSLNADWLTIRASVNIEAFTGIGHAEIIGMPATSYIQPELLHDVRGRMQQAGDAGMVEPLFGRQIAPGGSAFAVAVHSSGSETVLEFELMTDEPGPTPTAVRSMMMRVERHRAMGSVFREAARQVMALTGFDRVMIYRFGEDGSGEVVGEAVRGQAVSFLGLRYPASDIPAQARAMYKRNLSRIIVDTDAPAVAIVPEFSPEGQRLDLTSSVMRSVSPIHLEYLRNMGVRSSMSISLLQGGRLWGLIACHHLTPRHVGLETRLTTELFGQMFAYLMDVRRREEEAVFDERTRQIHNRIATAYADRDASLHHIPLFLSELTDYVDADGIGVYHGGEVSLTGTTPTQEEFIQLVRFLNKTTSAQVFATHELSAVYPPAADFRMRAAGVLCIPISRTPRDYVVFFRTEVARMVTWAGEPVKTEGLGPNGVRLTPRKSFEAWSQSVEGQSQPWKPAELRASESLRLTLVEIVLRLSDIAQADRLAAQHRQEVLIAELNHRVRNLLGLVRGIVIQSAASVSDVPSLVANLADRLQAMARAHDLLTQGNWTTGSLGELLRAELAAFAGATARVSLSGPDVILEPKSFSTMALIVHELVTNARKHGALRDAGGRVTITTSSDPVGVVTIGWLESGGPLVLPPTRRGFGSTIIEQAIPFELGGTSIPRYTPTGFSLEMVLPAASATLDSSLPTDPARAAETVPDQAGERPAAPSLDALLETTLIVEDNLFIAIDAEDILRKAGADMVLIARNVAEALSILKNQRPSFALLDINLGTETSMPIAHALMEQGVIFAFGTGYGDAVELPASLAQVPVVSKPYSQTTIVRLLQQLYSPGITAPMMA
jgi:light-regulated signal transduction histidine kinase (bacteriophytochrome)/CheY-like chemotaxis protein